jgi:hypothetical protein
MMTPTMKKHRSLRAEDFSSSHRPYAIALVKWLKRSGDIDFNSNMEIILRGKVIRDSNIISLIEQVVSKDNNNLHLKGLKRFYTLLHKIHVPPKLIRNKWAVSFK